MQPYPVFTKKYVILWILIVLLDGWECQATSDNILRRIAAIRFNKSKELRFKRQAAASDEDESYSYESLFEEEYDSLECGKNYHLVDVGHAYFNLGPGEESCEYSFYGSKKAGCKAAVYCAGLITLKPKSKITKRCEDEYLVIKDNTEGEMTGCGEFTFHKTPRYPRNEGANLYVRIKGDEAYTRCIAFCLKDVDKGYLGLQPAKQLAAPGTPVNQKDPLWVPSPCKCGVRRNNARIVGGEIASFNEFPWIAALVYGSGRAPHCAASLINSRYVLTAAHCFKKDVPWDEVEILLHAHVLDKNPHYNWTLPDLINVPGWNLPTETDDTENSIRVYVEEAYFHPKFDLDSYYYDFALLKLLEPIDFSDPRVAPICLPTPKLNYEDGKSIMTVAGWGNAWEGAPATSRVLLKVDVPYISNELCHKYTTPAETHFCAGDLNGGKDSCQGDSGGPAMYQLEPDVNKYVLAGMVSAGVGCARESQPGWYTDIKCKTKEKLEALLQDLEIQLRNANVPF